MVFYHQTDDRVRVPVVDLVGKVFLYLILAALVDNLISKTWHWRPFWIKQPMLLIRLTQAILITVS